MIKKYQLANIVLLLVIMLSMSSCSFAEINQVVSQATRFNWGNDYVGYYRHVADGFPATYYWVKVHAEYGKHVFRWGSIPGNTPLVMQGWEKITWDSVPTPVKAATLLQLANLVKTPAFMFAIKGMDGEYNAIPQIPGLTVAVPQIQ